MSDEPTRPWWAEDIRSAWKWLTVQLGAVLAIVPQLYEYLPLLREHLSDAAMHNVMSAMAVLAIVANLRNKEPKA